MIKKKNLYHDCLKVGLCGKKVSDSPKGQEKKSTGEGIVWPGSSNMGETTHLRNGRQLIMDWLFQYPSWLTAID